MGLARSLRYVFIPNNSLFNALSTLSGVSILTFQNTTSVENGKVNMHIIDIFNPILFNDGTTKVPGYAPDRNGSYFHAVSWMKKIEAKMTNETFLYRSVV